MYRTIVADDHTLFRAGLLRMLSEFPEVTVVAEAEDGHQTLAAVQATPADLLLLDLAMPGPTGVALIETLRQQAPLLPILVLTMHDEPATIRRTLQAGATGFITKDADPEVLRAAIGSVVKGSAYVAPTLAAKLAMSDDRDLLSREAALSPREKEVLALIAEGVALNVIAQRLCLSPKTVTTHKANLMDKLGIRNNADLIRFALERGKV